jgi:hypothetical protein
MPAAHGIRAGAAYVELFVQDNRLVRGLNATAQRLKTFGAGLTAIGSKVALLGGAALTPLLGMVQHFAAAGDELNKMSIRTGFSTEALSELGFAAEQSGTNLNQLGRALFRMRRRVANAATDTGPAVRALKELGLNARELTQLSPEDQFTALVGALGGVANESRRAQLGFEILGDNARALLPLLNSGTDGIEAMRKEARALGLSVSTGEAQAAADYADAWNRVTRAFKATVFAIGAALAPVLTELLGVVKDYVVGLGRWVRENRGLVVSIAKIAAIVVGVGIGLIVLGTIIYGLGAALGVIVTVISGIGTAISLLGSLIGALLSPVGLVIAGITALVGVILYATGAGSTALNWLGERFNELKETALAAWQGIADALAAGDLGLAAKIVWLTLKMEWKKGLLWLEEKWLDFKNFFLDVFYRAVYALARFFNDAWAGIQSAWAETVTFLSHSWNIFISFLQRGWNRFSGFFKKVWARIKGVFGDSDAEEEIRRINEEVAQQDREIVQRRDAGILQRERERQQRRQQIEQERAGIEDELNRMQAQERAEREARKRADLKEAEDALARARKEWEEALAEAARKRAAKDAEGPARARGQLGGLDDVLDTAQEKAEVQGTFNALALRGFGGESLAERTAKVAEEIAGHAKKLVQEAQHGGLVFA